jgi:tetratricopeptide (TPR) repeat protein
MAIEPHSLTETSSAPVSSRDSQGSRLVLVLTAIVLCCAVFIVFGRAIHYPFINFDDAGYFGENPHVRSGLTWSGFKWAFQSTYESNWHPVTWLSLMLDAQWFGPGAAGPHFTNTLLHSVNAALLFLCLRRLTGALWPAAIAAALFAVHPLRVESVAWIAERKDVLSGLFFLLTLLTYATYANKAKRRRLDYSLSLSFFALGLMSKPMLVTTPFVLLLLDFWPLARFSNSSFRNSCKVEPREHGAPPDPKPVTQISKLLLEKAPFFLMSIAACAATVAAQQQAIKSATALPLGARLGNALISCATYFFQTLWPQDLSVFYSFDMHPALWRIVGAGLLLLAMSALAYARLKRMPWIAVGLCWYLGMLIPVLGFVQAGGQGHADRYTYLPQIGLCLALVWTCYSLAQRFRNGTIVFGALASILTGGLMLAAWQQAGYWRDSESLWKHAVACTRDNFTAHDYLGTALAAQARDAESVEEYRRALAIFPDFADANEHLGETLVKEGRLDEAEACLRKAVQSNPGLARAHDNLGLLLIHKGQTSQAVDELKTALDLAPDSTETRNNLGTALALLGRSSEAIQQFQELLKTAPDSAKARYNLANLLAAKGKLDQAIQEYQRALKQMPDSPVAHYQLAVALQRHGQFGGALAELEKTLQLDEGRISAINNMAWLLATCPVASLRDGTRAVEFGLKADQLSGGKSPEILDTLATAYAEAGKFKEAIDTLNRALPMATKSPALTQTLQAHRDLYQAGTPYHEKDYEPAP